METRIGDAMGGGIKNGSLARFHLHRCHYCDRTMHFYKSGLSKKEHKQRRPSRDHVIARSRGGKGIEHNRVICCSWCNSTKGSHSYEDFVAWIEQHFRRSR